LPALTLSPTARAQDVELDRKSFWDIVGEDDPNPTNYDFAFLSIGLHQNWGLSRWKGGGVYFGAGGGLGGPLWRITKMEDRDIDVDNTLEVVFGDAYLRLAPFHYMDLDVGGKIAIGSTSFGISDAPRSGFVRAAYADLRVGTKTIKFGPRLEFNSIVYSEITENGWKITPLMVRVLK
jgi:hypothetical protein